VFPILNEDIIFTNVEHFVFPIYHICLDLRISADILNTKFETNAISYFYLRI